MRLMSLATAASVSLKPGMAYCTIPPAFDLASNTSTYETRPSSGNMRMRDLPDRRRSLLPSVRSVGPDLSADLLRGMR